MNGLAWAASLRAKVDDAHGRPIERTSCLLGLVCGIWAGPIQSGTPPVMEAGGIMGVGGGGFNRPAGWIAIAFRDGGPSARTMGTGEIEAVRMDLTAMRMAPTDPG